MGFFNWQSSNSLFFQGRNIWWDSQAVSTESLALGIKFAGQGHISHTKLGWSSVLQRRLGWPLCAYTQETMPAARSRACAGWIAGGSTPEPKDTCQQHTGVKSLSFVNSSVKLKTLLGQAAFLKAQFGLFVVGRAFFFCVCVLVEDLRSKRWVSWKNF